MKCPDCFGDGVETCHNPDHSFIGSLTCARPEDRCPCCGFDPKHKMGGVCETCNGSGDVTKEEFNAYLLTVSQDAAEEIKEAFGYDN